MAAPMYRGTATERDEEKIRRLSGDYDRMYAIRSTHDDDRKLLGEFLLPYVSDFDQSKAPGEKKTRRLFDSEGIRAPEILASTMAGTMIMPSQKWASIVPEDPGLREDDETMDWCEDTRDRVFTALSNSNFYQASPEALLHLAVFGTSAVYGDEGPVQRGQRWGGLRFKTFSPEEYVIAEGADERVNRITRKFTHSASACAEQWPNSAGDVITRLSKERPEQPVEVFHAIVPRDVRNPNRADSRNMAFASYYFSREHRQMLSEGGFTRFPVAVSRWAKAAREVYGTGPGHTALPDIRSLNRLMELTLSAGAKAIDPPLEQLNEAVKGDTSLEPASINYVTQLGAIKPIEGRQNFSVAELLWDRLERKIRQIFYTDVLLLLRTKPQMTATEVMAVQEEMYRILGPTAGRLYSEWLSPQFERSVALMFRAGQLRRPPARLLEGGGNLAIEFQGPLARAQKAIDLDAIRKKNAWINEVFPFYPDAVLLFDHAKEGRHMAEVVGYPADLVRSPEDVERDLQARAEAAAKQAQVEQVMAGAETAGKAAPFLKVLGEQQPGQQAAA